MQFTYSLRRVHHCHSRHGRELAEELQSEVAGSWGGEALEHQLLQASKSAPLQLSLELLQALAVLWQFQRNPRQQLVHQPQRHLILELKI